MAAHPPSAAAAPAARRTGRHVFPTPRARHNSPRNYLFPAPVRPLFFPYLLPAVTPTVSPGVRFGRTKDRQGAV